MFRTTLGFLILALSLTAQAALQTEEVDYEAGGQQLQGYLAYDDAVDGKRPGILVVHEWWGHNEYARKRAEMLADMGYTAFAVDMYGKGKLADHPEDAKGFMSSLMSDLSVAEARFDKALEILTGHETVDAGKTAAIGYCMGGGLVLYMAAQGKDLDGVVSYHGSLGLASRAEPAPGDVDARVLVFTGGADDFVPTDQVQGFIETMRAAQAQYALHSYPGVKHSFTNPEADRFAEDYGMPIAYDREADEHSWRHTGTFFDDIFR
jgi:dienelactone hydrolase